MSRLENTQQFLSDTLWTEAGHQALDSVENWENFIKAQANVRAPYRKLHRPFSLYSELLQNTVFDTLSGFFPYCEKLLHEEWLSLCETYRRQYPNKSYQLFRCAENMPAFLGEQGSWVERYPFLEDLARYEWLEVQVENEREQVLPAHNIPFVPDSQEQLRTLSPIWNAASELQTSWYPIPRIIEAIQEDSALNQETDNPQWIKTLSVDYQLTTLFIFRDPWTHRARFFELNSLTAQLIQLSMMNPEASYETVLKELLSSVPELATLSLETLLNEGLSIFKLLHAEGILLGSCPFTVSETTGTKPHA